MHVMVTLIASLSTNNIQFYGGVSKVNTVDAMLPTFKPYSFALVHDISMNTTG